MIDEIIDYNKTFVAEKSYEKFITDKYPDKKLAVLSCMDTRLTELLPAALAGGIQRHSYIGQKDRRDHQDPSACTQGYRGAWIHHRFGNRSIGGDSIKKDQ